jgi:hypothetical protein
MGKVTCPTARRSRERAVVNAHARRTRRQGARRKEEPRFADQQRSGPPQPLCKECSVRGPGQGAGRLLLEIRPKPTHRACAVAAATTSSPRPARARTTACSGAGCPPVSSSSSVDAGSQPGRLQSRSNRTCDQEPKYGWVPSTQGKQVARNSAMERGHTCAPQRSVLANPCFIPFSISQGPAGSNPNRGSRSWNPNLFSPGHARSSVVG